MSRHKHQNGRRLLSAALCGSGFEEKRQRTGEQGDSYTPQRAEMFAKDHPGQYG
jgi:hypothetical protein